MRSWLHRIVGHRWPFTLGDVKSGRFSDGHFYIYFEYACCGEKMGGIHMESCGCDAG